MRFLNRNFFYKLLFIIIFLWAVLATYSSMNDLHLLTWMPSTLQGQAPYPTPNKKEKSQFLHSFLGEYYKIDKNVSKKERLHTLQDMISPPMRENILDEYSNTLEYFSSRKAHQKFSVKKITWHQKQNLYNCYLVIHQKFEKEERFFIKVQLEILEDHKNNYLISDWNEQIVRKPSKNFTDKVILMGPQGVSHLRLPCSITSVAPVSGTTDVEMRLESDSQNIKLYSSSNFSTPASFKVKCGQRTFPISLVYSPHLFTLYQLFHLSDGKQPKRKLSPLEKLKKDVETQLGIKIVE